MGNICRLYTLLECGCAIPALCTQQQQAGKRVGVEASTSKSEGKQSSSADQSCGPTSEDRRRLAGDVVPSPPLSTGEGAIPLAERRRCHRSSSSALTSVASQD